MIHYNIPEVTYSNYEELHKDIKKALESIMREDGHSINSMAKTLSVHRLTLVKFIMKNEILSYQTIVKIDKFLRKYCR